MKDILGAKGARLLHHRLPAVYWIMKTVPAAYAGLFLLELSNHTFKARLSILGAFAQHCE